MKYDLSIDYDRHKAQERFNKLLEAGDRIDLKKHVGSRTLQQNKYFHVCCSYLADYSGYTTDEVKKIIKDQLEFMTYTKNGHQFYVSSKDLDKEKFIQLIDFTRSFAETHGCTIPSSEDYLKYEFDIDKSLQHFM